MTSPRSGWYPDPQSPMLMRWWDGEQWTADTYERAEPIEDWSTHRTADRGPADRGTAVPGRATVVQAVATEDGVALAGWWSRGVARVLDTLLTTLVACLVGLPWLRTVAATVADQVDAAVRAAEQGAAAPALSYDGRTLTALAILSLLSLVVALAYELVFLMRWGATPGKLLLGLRVRRWDPTARLTATSVLRRWLAFEAASSLSYLGTVYAVVDLLWPLRDPRRQALHDKLAGTCVVTTR